MGTNEKKNSSYQGVEDSSRRKFLRNTGIATGGVVGGAILGGLLGNPFKTESTQPSAPVPTEQVNYNEAMQFFTRQEDINTLASATEVIFPEDEIGPGAIVLGVPYFIDKQLAGPWGKNAADYRKFPLQEGESPLNRGEIFIEGLRKMNIISQEKFESAFVDLEEEQQIEVLQMFENNEVELRRVTSGEFFALLRQSTLEGCYCDSLYGGNRNMEGWKMKEFPGAQMSFFNEVENDFKVIQPISLSDHNH